MAAIIRIKRSTGSSAPSSLNEGELAYAEAAGTYGILYIGASGATVRPIAGAGHFAPLNSPALTGTPTAPTPSTSDDSTKIATTAYVKAQSYLTSAGATPGTYTKVTVAASGLVTSGTTLSASDIPTLTASKISDFDTQVRSSRLDQMAAPTSDVSMNSVKISNLADPSSSQDAANKRWVEALFNGVDNKSSVRAATTGNVTLSGGAPSTVDTVSLAANDLVLVWKQTDPKQNGVYKVQTLGSGSNGTWVRADLYDQNAEVTSGLFVFVEEGSAYVSNGFTLTTPNPIVLDTTNLTFIQTSGAGQILEGTGIDITGNTVSVLVGGSTTYTAGGILYHGSTSTISSAQLTGVLKGNGSGAPTAMTGAANRLVIWSDANTIASDPNLTWASNTLTFGAATSLVSTAGAITVQPVSGSNFNITLGTTGDLAVNTNQLYVDTSAARVGINKSNPTCALDVVGSAAFANGFSVPGGTDSTIGGTLSLNTALSTSTSDIAFRVGGLYRWIFNRGGEETGSNAGGNLTLYSYQDNGDYLRTHVSFIRSTGASNFAGPVSIPSLTVTTATTLTGFTAGSVLFAGAGSVVTQDNASLFWDDTNNRLCLGTTTSVGRLTVYDDATGDVAFVAMRHGTNYGANIGVNTDGTGDVFIATVVTGTPTRRLTITRANGYVGINQSSPASMLDVTKLAIGVTQSDAYGVSLNNTTAAAAGAPQMSPPLVMQGQGWKTNSTAASQAVKFRQYVLPVEGAAAPTGKLMTEASINGGSYATVCGWTSGGVLSDGEIDGGTF